jgi:acetyl esterase
MKRVILLLTLPVLITAASQLGDPGADEDTDSCRNEKFATAEPGTCLDPRAYRLLKAVDRLHENPYNNEFAKRVIDIIEPGVKKVVDVKVPNGEHEVPVRIYYPSRESLQKPTHAIFFIHGGGFMFGSIEEYDMAVKKLARITDMIIIAADYRLAPEHPYPAALEDVDTVVEWVISNRKQLGIAGDRITLMGDSAGANLATVLAIKHRDEDKDLILAQVLYYPPTTFVEEEFPSRVFFLMDDERTYFLTEEFVRTSKEQYLADSIPDDHPYVSPLEADLSGNLPPVLLITAQVDPLRDDGRMYAEKLQEAGQQVTYLEYEGMIHGFMNFYMIFPEAKESMKKTRNFITSLVMRRQSPGPAKPGNKISLQP